MTLVIKDPLPVVLKLLTLPNQCLETSLLFCISLIHSFQCLFQHLSPLSVCLHFQRDTVYILRSYPFPVLYTCFTGKMLTTFSILSDPEGFWPFHILANPSLGCFWFVCLIIPILTGMNLYLIVVLIYTSVMVYDVEPFISLLVTFFCPLWKNVCLSTLFIFN